VARRNAENQQHTLDVTLQRLEQAEERV